MCDSREFAEWQAIYRLDPWGEGRADLRAGIIASTVANAAKGKRGRSAKPVDFMPKFGKSRKLTKAAEIKQYLVGWVGWCRGSMRRGQDSP